jgi:hypothetical protein
MDFMWQPAANCRSGTSYQGICVLAKILTRKHCGQCSQVEFNKAALSLAETIPLEQRKGALNRLLKVSGHSL